MWERCLSRGAVRLGGAYYNNIQIFQSEHHVAILMEMVHEIRIIPLDGSPMPDHSPRQWLGRSQGHWEGDTLVVEVTEQIDQTWLDRSGNYHSGAVRVVERYTPVTPYHMQYAATIDDPEGFTEPWTLSLPLYRRMEEYPRVLEYRCVEMVEELIYGHLRKEPLVTRWEGDYGRRGGTLGVDITRRPTSEDLNP